MHSSPLNSIEIPPLINLSSLTSEPSNTPILTTQPQDAAQLPAPLELVLMFKSTHQSVSTVTLMLDSFTMPATELVPATQDTILTQQKPSLASPAQLSIVMSVTPPTQQNAGPA